MMKCRKYRTNYLLSTRQNLRSNASIEMTYVRDTPLAPSFCSGSDHPELPRMIQANSVFQYWASPNNLVVQRMIWTQTGLTGLEDRSGPEQCRGNMVMRKMSAKEYIQVSSHLWHKLGYIQSDSKQIKHNFNICKLLVCFDQICKWASPYSLSNKVPSS